MKLPDQVREVVRWVTGLAPDHPIPDDRSLYSLGITPLGEVHICWELASRFDMPKFELLAEVLVGSNLQSHTVPFLVHSITEVLTNDSTSSSSQPADQTTLSANAASTDGGDSASRDESTSDAAPI